MKLPIFIFIPLLFLSSCTIDWNDEKDKKITELERQVQDNNFKKKQECFNYKKEIELKLLSETELYKNRSYSHNEDIIEIFYSPKYQSCLFSTKVIEIEKGETCEFYKIYDFMKISVGEIDKYLEFKKNNGGGIINTCDTDESFRKFQAKLKELKGE